MNSICVTDRRLRLLLVQLSLVLLSACQEAGNEEVAQGVAGVFFGGEVQELDVIELEIEHKKVLGFRLDFSKVAQPRPHLVHFEVTRPGPYARRLTEYRDVPLPSGRARFDQVIELPHDAPLGTLNVRAIIDDQLVIDRAILLRRPR